MVRVYSADEVHAALPWPALAAALEAAFVAGAELPLRHAHALSARDTLLLMPAWNAQAVVVKLVTVMPAAQHTVQASVMVLDRKSGQPLALLDGEALTLRRTAATSALAAQHLARADAHTLLVVGCGRLAGWIRSEKAPVEMRQTVHRQVREQNNQRQDSNARADNADDAKNCILPFAVLNQASGVEHGLIRLVKAATKSLPQDVED